MTSNTAFELLRTLTQRVQGARTPAELAFVVCNEAHTLARCRQAALVSFAGPRARLAGHSGLADVEPDAPYAQWLTEVATHLKPQLAEQPAEARVLAIEPAQLPAPLAQAWADWLPEHLWALGLAGPDGTLQAVLLLARTDPWPTQIAPGTAEGVLLAAAGVFGHAWWALAARRPTVVARLARVSRGRLLRIAALALVVLLLVPVREYALVPAEVVATRTEVIASPRDGVIRRMAVPPNTPVTAGQPIAELDDTTLYNRLAVAQAALATAQVEQHQASQRAIESQSAKSDLALAEGRLRERTAEAEALAREMERLFIRAPSAGVVVYSNPEDWAGRPVQTGERVGLLADPAQLGLNAWVPVAEAVNLAPGAAITAFLRVAPLDPLSARLDYASYQVVDSPAGVASYLVRATLTEDTARARIGLRGTARIAGSWTVLGYLLLRRPLAAAREWCGC